MEFPKVLSWDHFINVYIESIISALYNCNFHLYADDTDVNSYADSVHATSLNLWLSFNLLQKQLHNLKLVLNHAESKGMLFLNVRNVDYSSS